MERSDDWDLIGIRLDGASSSSVSEFVVIRVLLRLACRTRVASAGASGQRAGTRCPRGWLPNCGGATSRDSGPCRSVDSAASCSAVNSGARATQLAFWTVEHLLERGRLEPASLSDRFAAERIFGMGSSVREFVRNARAGRSWEERGARSAGNGALMRIPPVLLAHLRSAGGGLSADTVLTAVVTHQDPASTAACVAFVQMLWQLLGAERPPDTPWWLREYVHNARIVEGDHTLYKPRGGAFSSYAGPGWSYVDLAAGDALERRLSARAACDRAYSGAYVLETATSALIILALHGDDPEEAIVRAVNDTRDNDTIGAIVGSAVGALHGAAALPRRWKDSLLGRTRIDDDGAVFTLINESRKTFWDRPPLP